MKTHTIALVVSKPASPKDLSASLLLDVLQEEHEIEYLAEALTRGEKKPMQEILHRRSLINEREEIQADYIEQVLCRPFTQPRLQEQGLLWFKSKIKLDLHRRAELEAAKAIADYAYQIYQTDRSRTDFLLTGPKSQVRVRVFPISDPC